MPRLHQRNLLRATRNLLRATSIKLRAACCAGVNAALVAYYLVHEYKDVYI